MVREVNELGNDKVQVIEYMEDDLRYYAFEAHYFQNEIEAESYGYYWDDEVGKWLKEIMDETTTIF